MCPYCGGMITDNVETCSQKQLLVGELELVVGVRDTNTIHTREESLHH